MSLLSGLALIGINLSGAEYGRPSPTNPGRVFTDYVFPSKAEIDYYASKGFNIIRLPFLWERMQSVQGGALNVAYLQQMDQVVAYANTKGIQVDLDLHNYGRYYGQAVGTTQVPTSSLEDLWTRLASHYANAGVLFGLMNEPSSHTASAWAPIAARLVTAIRAAGATTQEILVPGGGWDGASSWVSSGNAAALSSAIVDPNNNYAFEVHQYLDPNESGTSTAVVSATIGVERVTAATNWAEAAGARLFLGEFAAGPDAASLTAMSNMLSYMGQHSDVWQGATYWAGGQWWGAYPFSVEPSGGTDRPQMAVLTQFLPVVAPAEVKKAVLLGFDATYYLQQNPDVAGSGVDPLQSFLLNGWQQARNPDAWFDVAFYLKQNPDVAAAGVNPLLHFEAYGWKEGRAPSLLFDPAKYLAAYTDVDAAQVNPLLHYIFYGQTEGRATFLTGGTAPADPLVDARFFDTQLGATLIPAGTAAAQQASFAYDQIGWQSGLDPDAWFDTKYYLAQNPDVAAAHVNPLLHYEQYGWHEGRAPSPGFSGAAYLAANPDVAAAGVNPLLHYVTFGQYEGRAALPV